MVMALASGRECKPHRVKSSVIWMEMARLLRRTFSEYQPPERRSIGSRVRNLSPTTPGTTGEADEQPIDEDRVTPAVQTVAAILGWQQAGDQR